MTEMDFEGEELDIEPYEGEPDFPSAQAAENAMQDDDSDPEIPLFDEDEEEEDDDA